MEGEHNVEKLFRSYSLTSKRNWIVEVAVTVNSIKLAFSDDFFLKPTICFSVFHIFNTEL